MFWIFLVVALIILAILLFIIYKKYERFVFEHSISLQKLDEINKKYDFHYIKPYKLENSYDNEKYYEMVSQKDFLIYKLQYSQKEVKNIIVFVLNVVHH